MTTLNEVAIVDLSPIHMRRGVQQMVSPPALLVEQFIAGPENASVVELFKGLSIERLVLQSPIVLFGHHGSGKTTLAHELLWRWSRDQGNRKLTLTSGTEFGRALQRGIKADDMVRFRQIHRQCDGLLIDNLHELATKPAAQAELVQILKDAQETSRLVVMTTTELPRLQSGLIPPLQSLLSAGLSIPVKLPGPQARLAICEKLSTVIAPELNPEDLLKSLSRISQDALSALQIKGLLNRWAHQLHSEKMLKPSSQTHTAQKSAAMRQNSIKQIEKMVGNDGPKITCKELLKLVAKEFGIKLDVLTGKSRKSGVVRARGLAMLLMRQMTNESFEAIGKYFSGRDHTTVIHACNITEQNLAEDSALNLIYDRIRQK
ncbi:MAG: helix-turn-helix domain-containing protein [Pirellula sp.]